jgi:tripartite-type tricarboxylate transporter receptor subunit TctC
MEYLRLKAPMNVVHVPYKSVGQAITGLIGNQAQIMFGVSPAAVPQIKAGRLHGLAVSTRKRSAAMPDLPTLEEAGIADFDAAAWNGLMVPAKTPREIVNKLHIKVAADLRLPDVIERTHVLGFENVGSTPAEFAAFLKAELDKWARVAKATGAKAE